MNDTEKKWVAIFAIIVVGFLVLNVISYVYMPFLPWMEERQAGQDVIEDTYNGESAVQQYEEFRTMYHDIEAQRNQVENSYDELDRFYETHGEDPADWSRTAEEDHSRIQQRITGNQNQLENMVAEYNAESDMANRELFKCSLPYQVDERFGVSGPPGSGDVDEPVDTDPDGEPIDGSPVDGEQCDGLPDQMNADTTQQAINL